MKRTVLIWIFMLLGCVWFGQSQAELEPRYSLQHFIAITRDQPILEALFKMQASPRASQALTLLLQRKARVFFKDLGQISKSVRDYDALSWIGPRGEWVIFINHKHKTAPPEALAAVISHEAVHNDPQNSMTEEIVGWHQEASVWGEMKQMNPALLRMVGAQGSLVGRLNEIEMNHQSGQLELLVRHNKGYINLPDASPGFSSANWQARLNSPYQPVMTEAMMPMSTLITQERMNSKSQAQ